MRFCIHQTNFIIVLLLSFFWINYETWFLYTYSYFESTLNNGCPIQRFLLQCGSPLFNKQTVSAIQWVPTMLDNVKPPISLMRPIQKHLFCVWHNSCIHLLEYTLDIITTSRADEAADRYLILVSYIVPYLHQYSLALVHTTRYNNQFANIWKSWNN